MVNKRPPRKVLKELLFDRKLSAIEIANHFGVSKRSVYDWLKFYKLPTPKQIMNAERDYQIVIDYIRLNPIVEIARQHQRHFKTISDILNNAGIDISARNGLNHVKHRMKHAFKPFTYFVAQILDGELLGDGNVSFIIDEGILLSEFPTDSEYLNAIDTLYLLSQINKFEDLTTAVKEFVDSRKKLMTPQMAYFRLTKAILEKPWVEYIAQLFRLSGYICRISPVTFKKREKAFKGITLVTRSSLQLERVRQRWYTEDLVCMLCEKPLPVSDGFKTGGRCDYCRGWLEHQLIKRVPRDLVLTPLIVLLWYIGDGTCGSETIVFSTQCFLKEDVEFLCDLLRRETQLPFEVRSYPTISANKNIISISSLFTEHFLSYLETDPEISEFLALAKQYFPWKFDRNLLKRECV